MGSASTLACSGGEAVSCDSVSRPRRSDASVASGVADLPRVDGVDLGGYRGRLTIDLTDSPTFPRHGLAFRADGWLARPALGDLDYERASLDVDAFVRRGRGSYLVGLAGGTDFGSGLPAFDAFTLGGLGSLGGLAEDQLRGSVFAVGRLGYYRQMFQLPTGIGDGVYVGGWVETGYAWRDEDAVDLDDLELGTTLFFGADTVLGPVLVGYGTDGKRRRSVLRDAGARPSLIADERRCSCVNP